MTLEERARQLLHTLNEAPLVLDVPLEDYLAAKVVAAFEEVLVEQRTYWLNLVSLAPAEVCAFIAQRIAESP